MNLWHQFSSVAQSCPTLCNPMNCSTSGLPVHHQLPESKQTHVHWGWCHPTISPGVISSLIYSSILGTYLPGLETKPCCVGPPKMDRSWWRGMTECGPLEKEMANHFSIFASRTPWTVQKGKKIGHWKMNSTGRCPTCHGQGGLVCCSSWGCKESDTTERLNWTELKNLRTRRLKEVFYLVDPKTSWNGLEMEFHQGSNENPRTALNLLIAREKPSFYQWLPWWFRW